MVSSWLTRGHGFSGKPSDSYAQEMGKMIYFTTVGISFGSQRKAMGDQHGRTRCTEGP
jgi:hypothetical protein